jgi:hypothetical protein
VTNGRADTMSGTSEVPQLADPLCARRKSAEVGQFRTYACSLDYITTVAIPAASAIVR